MSVAKPGALAIQMTLLSRRNSLGNELISSSNRRRRSSTASSSVLPKIHLTTHQENVFISKDDESIDLQTVEKRRFSVERTLPRIIRRMSANIMSTVVQRPFRDASSENVVGYRTLTEKSFLIVMYYLENVL